ncbi:MAG: glycosyltransferase family 39 protein [Armatimonadetes bacterium]|nr:glycosyltransferase family 39 protein [Armatimonadota bacterium]
MNETTLRRALLVLLAASLLLSLCFAIRVPFGDNPDETAHRDYIGLIVQERGFVRFIPHADLPEGAPSRDEAHQPPLYYLLCAPVYALSNGDTLAVRLVATVIQLATVCLTFLACRDLFPKRGEIAVGAAAFVAFLPIQAQLGAAISNDALTVLFCTAIFWRLAALVVYGQTVKDVLWLGALFGLGLWTKLSVVQLVPAFGVAYFLAVRGGRMTAKQAVLYGVGALALGTLIASPWLVRNTRLYGDPLTLGIYKLTGANFSPAKIQYAYRLLPADYFRAVAIRSFATFFYFLHPNLPIDPLQKFVGSPVPLVTVVAVAVASLAAIYRKAKEGGIGGDAANVLLLFGGAILLMLPFFTQFVLTVFQAQGRYFLPVLLPVAVITTAAWASRTFGADNDKVPANLLSVLWVPAVLLALAVYQLIGGGFVR